MPIDNRTPLRKAVDKLIAEGKLRQDKDLQDIFNLSKSTISAYLNNPRPGKRFINEFEKKFGISLNSFSTNEILQSMEPANHDAYTQSLLGQIKLLEKINDSLEIRLFSIETNLNEMKVNQAAIVSLIREAATRAAIYRYGSDKKKLDNELHEINKIVAASLK